MCNSGKAKLEKKLALNGVGLGLGTGFQSLLSLVAAGEPTIPTEVPLPVTMVSMFLFDYGEFIKDALGRIPHHVQVHRHLLLVAPHTFSGLFIRFLTLPWRKCGYFKFLPTITAFLFCLDTLSRMEVAWGQETARPSAITAPAGLADGKPDSFIITASYHAQMCSFIF